MRVIEKLLKAQLADADAPRAGQRRPLGALPLNAQPQPQAAALVGLARALLNTDNFITRE